MALPTQIFRIYFILYYFFQFPKNISLVSNFAKLYSYRRITWCLEVLQCSNRRLVRRLWTVL
jgi:hypothetical protein